MRLVTIGLLGGFAAGLAGCNTTEVAGVPGAPSFASSVDLTARRSAGSTAKPVSGALLAADSRAGHTFNFGSDVAEIDSRARPATASREDAGGIRPVALTGNETAQPQGGSYLMNFEDAEIKDVLQAVLGNILGFTYTVAPNVGGRITVSSTARLTRAEVLSTLETALAAQNIALTKVGSTYRVAPMTIGGGGVVDGGEALPGNGVSVIPLRFTSVATMMKLLSGFIAETDGLRVDPGRNAIVVRGPAPSREEVVRAVESFDTDWMQNQSVSLFEVRRARVEAVVSELTRIFDNENNGNGAGLIQFKPISRMRAVLAMSKNPALIRRAETWVRRLDQQSDSATENVFVYRPRYRDAKELARLVSGLFKNSGSAGSGLSEGPGAAAGSGLSTSPFGGGAQEGGGRSGETGAQGTGNGLNNNTQQGLSAQPVNNNNSIAARMSGGGMTSDTSASDLATGMSMGTGDLDAGRGGQSRRIPLSINADATNNTVVSYTDGETYQKVLAVLRNLDVQPLQVAINVTIAEVQLNDALKYGIQFYMRSNRFGLPENRGSIGLGDTAEQVLKSKLPGFNFVGGGTSSPDLIISALDGISKVQVLSSPSLVVMENRPAMLQVGDQVPVTTRQGQSVLNTDAPIINQVDFKDTGIILKIIPRVGQNDTVSLDVEQEISNVVKDSNTLTPTISRRRVASSLAVNNGQTVLLAGLISENRHSIRDGIPYLARTVIGDLFGSTDKGFDRTELVMFIRPVVVRNGEDASSVAEEFRSRLQLSGAGRGAFRQVVRKP